MSLLKEIQGTLLDDTKGVATALLKFRFLAAKLGSEELVEWVKYETDGYPTEELVPEYRITPLFYTGTFINMAYQYNGQQIPSAIIRQHAGERWMTHKINEGMASLEHTVANAAPNAMLTIDSANLLLLLQGKVYERMNLQSISGMFGISVLVSIQSTVRSRLLDLTLELEKKVPSAGEITVGGKKVVLNTIEEQRVTQIFNQTIHGNMTNISSTGSMASISVNVVQGDATSLIKALSEKGLTDGEAKELAQIVGEEEPEGEGQPFGKRALAWIGDKASKGAGAVWQLGIEGAKLAIAEEVKKYYGG